MGVYKQVTYRTSRIDICRNCGGMGEVSGDPDRPFPKTCPVCDGKGRVRRTTEGVLTIENI